MFHRVQHNADAELLIAQLYFCLSNAMHGKNINLPVCVCVCASVAPLSTRLQVNGFLQLIA